MGYVQRVELDEINLPSDPKWKVWLKRRPSYADELACNFAGATSAGPAELVAYVNTRTLRMIDNWNLTDEQDQELPVTSGSLDLLSREDGEFLMLAAKDRFDARSDDDDTPFGKTSSTSITGTSRKTPTPSAA